MRTRRLTTIVAAVAAALSIPLAAVPAQAAETVPPFYQAPATLPANNGDVIRSEKLGFLLDPASVSSVAYNSTKVLYRTTNRTGKAIAVSGSVLVPKAPWIGFGKRPIIGYAVGTQGIGDRCAPSRQLSEGFEYESIFIAGLLARGYAIAMTDYEGLGTVGPHTYMDRESQGRAVLDMVRASQRLSGSGLSSANPVAIYGYSQGGAGAASAAELAGTYAPELKVKGTVAGAVPSDLSALPGAIDGTLYAEFLWYAMHGVSASYGLNISSYLNAEGKAMFDEIQGNCVFDLLGSAFSDSSDYTADGSSLATMISREPFRTMIADQKLGKRKPSAPVLVTHSLIDDAIPYRLGAQLASDWCDRGANVQFATNLMPGHVGGALANSADSYAFLEARFAGLPALSSCWRL